jgi:hypothetical protein
MLDHMLIIVMRGGLTTAQKTMLKIGGSDQVGRFRQLFENQMTRTRSDIVEQLTGPQIRDPRLRDGRRRPPAPTDPPQRSALGLRPGAQAWRNAMSPSLAGLIDAETEGEAVSNAPREFPHRRKGKRHVTSSP